MDQATTYWPAPLIFPRFSYKRKAKPFSYRGGLYGPDTKALAGVVYMTGIKRFFNKKHTILTKLGSDL